MKLLLDIGNSRLKWAQCQTDLIADVAALDYQQAEFLPLLHNAWQALPTPQVLVISVVGAQTILDCVLQLAAEYWPQAKIIQPSSTGVACGVTNAYLQPEKLGVDRWLVMLAAHQYYAGAVCVVDCGTAITLDMLTTNGQHLGGLIAPGLSIMRQALVSNTASLNLSTAKPLSQLANNTQTAIANGVLLAAVGLIETTIARQKSAFQLIITGGDATLISQHLTVAHKLDADLLFRGLAIISEETVV